MTLSPSIISASFVGVTIRPWTTRLSAMSTPRGPATKALAEDVPPKS
jgi:hypothetical protein